MGILNRILGRETRSVGASDPYLAEFLGQRPGLTGHVDPARASGIATAQACINTISQSLASVPLNLYRRDANGGRERAPQHPLYGVLHDQFRDGLTAYEGREYLVASLLIAGNAYARIETNGRGQVIALHLLNPANVAVEQLQSGRLRYRVTDPRGGVTIHLQDELLHLRYRLGPDGVTGLSPLYMARETFDLALTQQDQASKQARKAFRPEGVLSFPNPLGNEAKSGALDALGRKVEDTTARGGILVLDGGAGWSPLAFSSKDAEFLESRKLTNLDIARIFGVPPTVAGITDNATYSNVDGESRALVVRCLAPMARRIEQAMNAALLTAEGRKTLFVEHDLAGLMRGDMKARYEAYRIGREWGWLAPNEIRGWENLREIEGGDEFLTPLNMTTVGDREGREDGEP